MYSIVTPIFQCSLKILCETEYYITGNLLPLLTQLFYPYPSAVIK